jgi:thioesterase domain-containing protein
LATVIDISALTPEVRRTGEAHLVALQRYRLEPCELPIAVYRARNRGLKSLLLDDSLGWSAVASGNVISRETPGDHVSMISEPHLAALAAELSKGLVMMDASAQTLPTCGVSADAVTMRPD